MLSYRASWDSFSPFERLIERLETEWLQGQPPHISSILIELKTSDMQELADLIEVDLEYRWKRYGRIKNTQLLDCHDFPKLALLEDYSRVIPSRSEDILTPHLYAEEYRVRSRWGDKPTRKQILSRQLNLQAEIEAKIDRVDIELLAEDFDSYRTTRVESCDHTRNPSTITDSTEIRLERVPQYLNRYRLEARLGSGTFGEVWRAYDERLDTTVAIKGPRTDRSFSREEIQRFVDEARRARQLECDGVVPVYDVFEEDDVPFIVMRYMEGGSLATKLESTQLNWVESAELVASIAEILHQIHVKNFVHRDIKPANILFDRKGNPYVADLGLAASELEQIEEPDGTLGTLVYMPLEQADKKSNQTDGRADIYSLGVILYQLLSGHLPYVARTRAEYLKQLNGRTEPKPPRQRDTDNDIPKELERICLRCVKTRVEDRYTTAKDVCNDLRSWLSNNKPNALRRRVANFSIVVLMAAVLVSAVVWVSHAFPKRPSPKFLYDELEVLSFNETNDLNYLRHEDGVFRGDSFADLCLVSYGVSRPDTFAVRVTISVEPNKTQAGIFWGWRSVKNDLGADQKRFVGVFTRFVQGEERCEVLIKDLTVQRNMRGAYVQLSPKILARGSLKDHRKQEMTLEVHVQSSRLRRLTIDSRPVDFDVREIAFVLPDQPTKFGLLGVNGGFTFSDGEFSTFQELKNE